MFKMISDDLASPRELAKVVVVGFSYTLTDPVAAHFYGKCARHLLMAAFEPFISWFLYLALHVV